MMMQPQPYYSAQGYYSSGQPVMWHGVPLVKPTPGQRKGCNDVFFSVLFFIHLGIIGYFTATYTPLALDLQLSTYNNSINNGNDYYNVNDNKNNNNGEQLFGDRISIRSCLILVAIAGGITFLLSEFVMIIFLYCAHGLITTALLLNILSMCLILAGGIVVQNPTVIVIGSLAVILSTWFTCSIWNRIPFAAANLRTATRAIRDNLGVTIFAFFSLILTLLWNIWFMITFSSFVIVEKQINNNNQQNGDQDNYDNLVQEQHPDFFLILFFFFVSYFWTFQIIKNHVHVTVAGTVGTWWFSPKDASSCCSCAVVGAFFRASTYSFGSICMGSLLIAIVQAIREMLNYIRESDDGLLLCLADCCLSCIESIVEYFNQWAYVYVALYGYPFLEAGQQVMRLFTARGWTVIVSDYLVQRVLVMVSMTVGLVTGTLTVLIAKYLPFNISFGYAFTVGVLIGTMLTSVLMNVIGSAVDTVIVCFAEAPQEFHINHPELHSNMVNAWRSAWPTQFSF